MTESSNQGSSDKMGEFIEKALPISIVIAAYQAALVKPVTDTIISRIEEKRKLSEKERTEFRQVVKAEIASLPPSVFSIDPNWRPTTSKDIESKIQQDFVKEKLEQIIELVKKGIKKRKTVLDYLQ